jgi:periplasmic protein TonB
MNPFLYAMNIGTLAAWMSVSSICAFSDEGNGLSLLGLEDEDPMSLTDGEVLDLDSFAAGSSSMAEIDTEDNQEQIQDQQAAVAEELPLIPEVPEMPEIAETTPLPDVPEMPDAPPEPAKPDSTAIAEKPKTRSAPRASTSDRAKETKRGSTGPVARRTTQGNGTGSGSGGTAGSGEGKVGAARFAGGRMPRPPYPANATKENIEGSITVVISVDERGNVVNVSIRNASHPYFNNPSVINTCRRWKFRPGPRATFSRVIRFKLN